MEVVEKAIPLTAFSKSAKDLYQKKLDEYGKRSLEAETAQGVDWKAMSHAVRIAQEAIEFLDTGFITLPRPNAAFLLDIKNGKFESDFVSQMIDDLLIEVEQAVEKSNLPEEPDKEWIDSFVAMVHADIVKGEF